MLAGRYLFIPFLRTKSHKRQTKNRSSKKLHKNVAGRIPETTRIVVQNSFYPNLGKIGISKKNTRNNENSRPI